MPAVSLAVETELVNQASAAIMIKEKANTIKKCQPSTKPMHQGYYYYSRNLYAHDWQSNSHQKEPASIFTTYWNGLSKTNKEVYKCKAALQGAVLVMTQMRSNGQIRGGMVKAGWWDGRQALGNVMGICNPPWVVGVVLWKHNFELWFSSVQSILDSLSKISSRFVSSTTTTFVKIVPTSYVIPMGIPSMGVGMGSHLWYP
ncbi:hypothetical protein BDR03DRAFT_1028078 [Suillus americanus]|nr:hypothetical protein BDR03DRAFT_1028078 [Suillus americanus]